MNSRKAARERPRNKSQAVQCAKLFSYRCAIRHKPMLRSCSKHRIDRSGADPSHNVGDKRHLGHGRLLRSGRGRFCTVEGVAETKRSLSSGKTPKTQHTATVCAKDVLKLVDVLQFVKLRYRPDAIQWEYPQLVTDLSRSTAATALIVDRAARARPCARRLGITVNGRCLHSPVDSEGTP
jgi:hypothetical protein